MNFNSKFHHPVYNHNISQNSDSNHDPKNPDNTIQNYNLNSNPSNIDNSTDSLPYKFNHQFSSNAQPSIANNNNLSFIPNLNKSLSSSTSQTAYNKNNIPYSSTNYQQQFFLNSNPLLKNNTTDFIPSDSIHSHIPLNNNFKMQSSKISNTHIFGNPSSSKSFVQPLQSYNNVNISDSQDSSNNNDKYTSTFFQSQNSTINELNRDSISVVNDSALSTSLPKSSINQNWNIFQGLSSTHHRIDNNANTNHFYNDVSFKSSKDYINSADLATFDRKNNISPKSNNGNSNIPDSTSYPIDNIPLDKSSSASINYNVPLLDLYKISSESKNDSIPSSSNSIRNDPYSINSHNLQKIKSYHNLDLSSISSSNATGNARNSLNLNSMSFNDNNLFPPKNEISTIYHAETLPNNNYNSVPNSAHLQPRSPPSSKNSTFDSSSQPSLLKQQSQNLITLDSSHYNNQLTQNTIIPLKSNPFSQNFNLNSSNLINLNSGMHSSNDCFNHNDAQDELISLHKDNSLLNSRQDSQLQYNNQHQFFPQNSNLNPNFNPGSVQTSSLNSNQIQNPNLIFNYSKPSNQNFVQSYRFIPNNNYIVSNHNIVTNIDSNTNATISYSQNNNSNFINSHANSNNNLPTFSGNSFNESHNQTKLATPPNIEEKFTISIPKSSQNIPENKNFSVLNNNFPLNPYNPPSNSISMTSLESLNDASLNRFINPQSSKFEESSKFPDTYNSYINSQTSYNDSALIENQFNNGYTMNPSNIPQSPNNQLSGQNTSLSPNKSPSKEFSSSTETLVFPTTDFTLNLMNVYKKVDPSFKFSPFTVPERPLTFPRQGVLNDGYDNENSDYIMFVNDKIGDTKGSEYIILEALGSGTFGQVAKCQHIASGKLYAVKVVKNNPAYYSQSMMEVHLLNELKDSLNTADSNHFVQIREHFIFRNHLCIVNELLSINIYEMIKHNNYSGLSTKLIKSLSLQLLESLLILKKSKIIHCDLKPENIMLEHKSSTRIKVIDFGSACYENQTMFTYIQSRFYRSPEVILGLPYSSSIDMWSLGCIVAELFLGLPLFPGTSEFNQMDRIVRFLGNPPLWMLETGRKTNDYFKRISSNSWRIKTNDEYERENNVVVDQGSNYITSMNLHNLIISYPYKEFFNSQQIESEANNRFLLVDFLSNLLNLDPEYRLTPEQALLHPFISGIRPNRFDLEPNSSIPTVLNSQNNNKSDYGISSSSKNNISSFSLQATANDFNLQTQNYILPNNSDNINLPFNPHIKNSFTKPTFSTAGHQNPQYNEPSITENYNRVSQYNVYAQNDLNNNYVNNQTNTSLQDSSGSYVDDSFSHYTNFVSLSSNNNNRLYNPTHNQKQNSQPAQNIGVNPNQNFLNSNSDSSNYQQSAPGQTTNNHFLSYRTEMNDAFVSENRQKFQSTPITNDLQPFENSKFCAPNPTHHLQNGKGRLYSPGEIFNHVYQNSQNEKVANAPIKSDKTYSLPEENTNMSSSYKDKFSIDTFYHENPNLPSSSNQPFAISSRYDRKIYKNDQNLSFSVFNNSDKKDSINYRSGGSSIKVLGSEPKAPSSKLDDFDGLSRVPEKRITDKIPVNDSYSSDELDKYSENSIKTESSSDQIDSLSELSEKTATLTPEQKFTYFSPLSTVNKQLRPLGSTKILKSTNKKQPGDLLINNILGLSKPSSKHNISGKAGKRRINNKSTKLNPENRSSFNNSMNMGENHNNLMSLISNSQIIQNNSLDQKFTSNSNNYFSANGYKNDLESPSNMFFNKLDNRNLHDHNNSSINHNEPDKQLENSNQNELMERLKRMGKWVENSKKQIEDDSKPINFLYKESSPTKAPAVEIFSSPSNSGSSSSSESEESDYSVLKSSLKPHNIFNYNRSMLAPSPSTLPSPSSSLLDLNIFSNKQHTSEESQSISLESKLKNGLLKKKTIGEFSNRGEASTSFNHFQKKSPFDHNKHTLEYLDKSRKGDRSEDQSIRDESEYITFNSSMLKNKTVKNPNTGNAVQNDIHSDKKYGNSHDKENVKSSQDLNNIWLDESSVAAENLLQSLIESKMKLDEQSADSYSSNNVRQDELDFVMQGNGVYNERNLYGQTSRPILNTQFVNGTNSFNSRVFRKNDNINLNDGCSTFVPIGSRVPMPLPKNSNDSISFSNLELDKGSNSQILVNLGNL
ncbi:Serine/threonine-protein kinase ppk15 [Smittium culicis]|uniref:Serine/threonine-protein kinase ppk15 n=1 Tax=Smittium culicis TaxID=133412 RepID=A0A1R1Y7G7_9FUNG|nr:Serine/threonine-protein kinase ppk15 [Smittium culicis]